MLDLNNTQTIVSALSLSIVNFNFCYRSDTLEPNRFGRIIDRSRQVIAASSNLDKEDMLSTQHLKFSYIVLAYYMGNFIACLSIRPRV